MGWTVYCNTNTAVAATSWPTGPQQTFGASSAVGFYADQSGTAVTVGNYNAALALIQSTADPTITTYVCRTTYFSDTAAIVSTPNSGAYYQLIVIGESLSTPKPSYGIRFAFSTAGTVSFTAASAWYGVVNDAGVVVGDSSNCGFSCALKELASSQGWRHEQESDRKMSLNTATNCRMGANLDSTTTGDWYLAISLKPKSAGAKKGGVALDITYS